MVCLFDPFLESLKTKVFIYACLGSSRTCRDAMKMLSMEKVDKWQLEPQHSNVKEVLINEIENLVQ